MSNSQIQYISRLFNLDWRAIVGLANVDAVHKYMAAQALWDGQ
jgi:hypothetical protein